MTERGFWRFVWLAGVRLPWACAGDPWEATRMMLVGCATLVVARYTGVNLLARRRG